MDIFLRELTSKDIDVINQWRNDPSTVDMLGAPFRFINKEVDELWFENYLKNRSNNVRLAICETGTGLTLGAAYLLNIDWLSRNAEYAIWLGNKNNRGNGIGTKVTKLVLKHAFNDLNLHRIYLTLLESNFVALSLYGNMGFIKEGLLRDAIFKNGAYHNLITMSILNYDFNKNL